MPLCISASGGESASKSRHIQRIETTIFDGHRISQPEVAIRSIQHENAAVAEDVHSPLTGPRNSRFGAKSPVVPGIARKE